MIWKTVEAVKHRRGWESEKSDYGHNLKERKQETELDGKYEEGENRRKTKGRNTKDLKEREKKKKELEG